MTWAEPAFSRSQVDAAGECLARLDTDIDRLSDALEVVNNWRSSHSFPLNTFQVGLRRIARAHEASALVAQRLKRLSSIRLKLQRFRGMQLSRMQDIGGCRTVLASIRHVVAVREDYLRGDLKHVLVNQKDYITEPKSSGYRGVHLIYRYRSDRKQTYNGLLIEVQIRTRLQHAWATAVETVGTFLEQSLKSSQGSADWLRFFELMGSAFARVEGSPPVPNTPASKTELIREARSLARRLEVGKRLVAYGAALQTLEGQSSPTAKYFLLDLRPAEGTLTVTGYAGSALSKATSDYLEVEKTLPGSPGAEAVLVAAESIESLRRAYPNYFLDTRVFIEEMHRALER